jgi:hypothetical protein
MPGKRLPLPALATFLLCLTAFWAGGRALAQVGYGGRAKNRPTLSDSTAGQRTALPDTAAATLSPAEAATEEAPLPVEGEELAPAELTITPAPGDSLGFESPPTEKAATEGEIEGAPDSLALTKPATPSTPSIYSLPGGPPDAAFLSGPPGRHKLEPDATGRGVFGLGMRAPTADRRRDMVQLGNIPRQELPERYLQTGGASRLTSEIDLDLEGRTIRRVTRLDNIVVLEGEPEDISDHIATQIFAERFESVAKESRTLIGSNMEGPVGFGPGGGVTFQSPVSLGPAEAILGKGASITVRGSERISVSGTSRWDANPPPGETVRQSKFPQLDLRQDLNVKVDGKVGDKVTIDWTENTNEDVALANRIAIRYRGYEDEVMKEVDLGNTSLALPGTQFVSYNGQHQGLFGAKSAAQFGDIGLTVIASKQEGQTASNRFVGYAQETQRVIYDLDYVQRRFFFLVDPVDPLLTGTLLRLDQPGATLPPVITDLQVWRDNKNQSDNGTAVPGVAHLDPRSGAAAPRDSIEADFDALRETEDYTIRNDLYTVNVLLPGQTVPTRVVYPVLDMLSPIGAQELLAATFTATYALPGGGTQVVRYGTPIASGAPPDIIRAKALYIPDGDYKDFDGEYYSREDRANNRPSFLYPIRRLELRNIYALGGDNIDLNTLDLSVKRANAEDPVHFPGDASATYLRGLGIDREGAQQGSPPDDRLDSDYFYPGLGMVVLPDLRPFAPAAEDSVWPFFVQDLPPAIPPNGRPAFFVGEDANANPQNVNQSFYDKRPGSIQQSEDRKYFFDVKYATPQTQFVLNAPGTILDGSEAVVVDGRTLTRGTDYTIDYETGIVNLIGQTALPENAQVSIDYAYAPLFALGQKTLMGFNAGWDPGVGSRRFGTTWLFESAGVSERRPKLGEEPTRTIVGDLNGGFQTRPFLFNRLVDAIPGIRPASDSQLDVTSELALSLPNPNTKGAVYIDDFEGAKDNTVLSLQRDDWFWSSFPDTIGLETPVTPLRGKLVWYNPVTSPAREEDLFPEIDSQEGNDRKSIIALEVNPRVTGDPNVNPAAWVGLTQGVAASGVDFSRKQFIEIWLNDFQDPVLRSATGNATMVVDLGVINEDAQWDTLAANGIWDTEDSNQDGILDRSSVLFEDTGLDALESADEPGYNGSNNRDPHQDDFSFEDREEAEDNPNNPRFFDGVNRLEINSHLDTEDINRDNTFQRSDSNNFLRFVVPLSDSSRFVATDVARDFPGQVPDNPENGTNGWRLFRIPLEEGEEVGRPSLGGVRHLRIMFTGFTATQLLQVASVDILGNLFKSEALRDATGTPVDARTGEAVKLRAINNKEDANEYEAPFELQEQNRVTEREQSLAIDFENLSPGNEGAAFRSLPSDKDFTLYENLKWYVHGDSGQPPGMEAFIRFAADTLNYYEYAIPVNPGWTEEIVPLIALSGLKQISGDEDSCQVGSALVPCFTFRQEDGRLLRFVGKPSLTRVRRVVFGVRNASTFPQSGSVWFDDLRLDNVIRDVGTALRFEVNAGFADFLTLSTSLLTQDEDFLSIGSGGGRTVTRGSGSQQRDLAIRSTMNLHKFFETSGIKLPVAFNLTEQRELPEFRAGDDVVLNAEQSVNQERGAVGRGYSANFSRSGAQSGILKYTLDALRADFSLNDRRGLSQTRRDSARAINVGLAYAINPAFAPIRIGKTEIRYFPDNISLSARLNSNRSFSFDRDLDDPDHSQLISAIYQKDANLSGSTAFTFLRSVRTNYRIDSRRDLTFDNPAAWLGGMNIGWEVQRAMNLDINWNPPVLRLLAPSMSFRGGSRDDHSPQIQLANDSLQVRNLSASQNLSGSLNVPISLLTGTGGAVPDSAASIWRQTQGQLGRVGKLRDIRVSLSANNTQDFNYATGVPRWQYQLGLSIHPGADVELTERGRENLSTNRTASLASGIDLPLGIGAAASYAWSRRRTEQTFTVPRVGRTVTWPQVDLDWRSFQSKIPHLDRVFKALNLESRYTRDRSETGPESNESENITIREDWNPIVGVNGTVGKGWTLRSRFGSTTSEDSDNNASLASFTSSTRRQVSINISRRFDTASGLRLFWMKEPIKLKSDLVFSTDLTYSTDKSESGRRGVGSTVNRDGSTTSIRTGATYKFRKNIDGDLSVNLGRNNNNKTGQKLRTAALSGSVVFNF